MVNLSEYGNKYPDLIVDLVNFIQADKTAVSPFDKFIRSSWGPA